MPIPRCFRRTFVFGFLLMSCCCCCSELSDEVDFNDDNFLQIGSDIHQDKNGPINVLDGKHLMVIPWSGVNGYFKLRFLEINSVLWRGANHFSILFEQPTDSIVFERNAQLQRPYCQRHRHKCCHLAGTRQQSAFHVINNQSTYFKSYHFVKLIRPMIWK